MNEKSEAAVVELSQLVQTLIDQKGTEVQQLAERLVEAFDAGGRLIIAGSGPLVTLAQLSAQHFVYRLALDRPLLPAIALGGDAVLASALTRQGEQTQIYLRQWQTLNATEEDLLLVLADDGYDDGLKILLLQAQEEGVPTVALVQGEVEEHFPVMPDMILPVETTSMVRFSEVALFFGNHLCELVEAELFGV